MLLDKTFRVFRRWKGAVAVVAVFIALFLVVGFDLTGYETRVPDPAQVASVEIGRLRSEPNDDGSFLVRRGDRGPGGDRLGSPSSTRRWMSPGGREQIPSTTHPL